MAFFKTVWINKKKNFNISASSPLWEQHIFGDENYSLLWHLCKSYNQRNV